MAAWVLGGLVLWFAAAVGAAVLLGGVIRLADRRGATRAAARPGEVAVSVGQRDMRPERPGLARLSLGVGSR